MILPQHILVVDDEPDICQLLKEILEDEGFEVSLAATAEQARQARRARRPDLVLLDIWLPDTDGIGLLKEWSEGDGLDVPVIVMSGHGTVETAVEATRLGAYDFLEKPLSIAKLLLTMQRALEATALKRENIGLKRQAQSINQPVGNSLALIRLREQIVRIAAHQTSVFMIGEPGSGKELFARYLHANSPRAAGPFISVGVAALARENPAIELFGTEEAGKVHFGWIEQANSGTLLLKDIADLDLSVQARLLGVLEHQSLLRVGGREPVIINVRIVAATRYNLQQPVQAGQFRDDLYYHLNVVPLHIPPLREHADDIPELLEYYIDHFTEQEGLPHRRFTLNALRRLRGYEWPGNIRELKNLVQRLLILGTGETIESGEVDAALGIRAKSMPSQALSGFDRPLREAREEFEKAYLEYQL
nr:sigma-54 dependent transcriptional regulator [Pseudomonadota bacterium]